MARRKSSELNEINGLEPAETRNKQEDQELKDLEPAQPKIRKEDYEKKYKEEIESLKKKISELTEEIETLKKENEKLREDRSNLITLHNKIFNDINLLMKVARPPIILRNPVSFSCLSYHVERIQYDNIYILNQNDVICGDMNANNNRSGK